MKQLEINKQVIKKITIQDKPNNRTVVVFRFGRDEDGLKIYCKSRMFETYFKRVSDGIKMHDGNEWYGNEGYSVPSTSRNRDLSRAFDNWGYNEIFVSDSIPNISWLRTVGLKDGISFTFRNEPIHSEDYKTYIEKTLKLVEQYYNDYIRPKSTTGRITSKLSGDI